MSNSSPLLWIGATGGSGTRALVAALAAAGVFPGRDLNDSLDALPMAAVYDRHLAGYLAGEGFDEAAWRVDLAAALARHAAGYAQGYALSGEESPRCFYARSPARCDARQQISSGGTQWPLHGVFRQSTSVAAARPRNAWRGFDSESLAAQSLRLWSAVNLRGRDRARRYPGRCALIRYEDFCARPAQELARVGAELGLALDLVRIDQAGITPSHRALPDDWCEQLGDAFAVARPALATFGYHPC
ncbi:MAG: hypothetical protein IPH23_04170 [Gammaproteobacteria bacterium]|nr:hypothetical protein [Gammaproteobacteria bacterium]